MNNKNETALKRSINGKVKLVQAQTQIDKDGGKSDEKLKGNIFEYCNL